ncbi:Hydrophobic surface binding protein [Mycena sanguinolenta]|uniref:Hydrophobic surface binding protein n=1 Tax=Mycena sanguinolenta TaxID=230812 RepID=A0A8H6XZB3_9AGAR|nr:Hydrophobic surface binding protein [Mycena sanguinolenta]
MVQFTRSFCSLCLIAVSFAAPTKRTVAQVEADITDISNQATTLDNDIKGFPASGIFGALAMENAVGSLETALNKGTSDVQATGLINEADATTMLNAVKAIEPTIIDGLEQLTAKESDIFRDPPKEVVLSDLKNLQTATDAFAGALIAAAPADLTAQATSIQSAIDAAFATAIAAYS